ncbi:unnamed protein product, partial [Pleuronectes platessa]
AELVGGVTCLCSTLPVSHTSSSGQLSTPVSALAAFKPAPVSASPSVFDHEFRLFPPDYAPALLCGYTAQHWTCLPASSSCSYRSYRSANGALPYLTERYRSYQRYRSYWSANGALPDLTECYRSYQSSNGALPDLTERYRSYRSANGALRDLTECYRSYQSSNGALPDLTERYRSYQSSNGALPDLTERYRSYRSANGALPELL